MNGKPEDRVDKIISDLLRGRRLKLRGGDAEEKEAITTAARLAASRTGPQRMRPEFRKRLEQALVLLRELQSVTGRGQYVFPSLRSGSRPMSENTVNAALRRMGYSTEEMTGHGFRSLASTCLNEQGYHPDLIELQLAHAERNQVRAAYNKAQRLPERRKMMQAWADYLDGLRAGANVVPIQRMTG